MASMKWVKPAQATLDYFERLAPGVPLETRRMFGLPSRFLNGYMLVGVFGDALVLHLSEADRKQCIATGAEPFKPLGREMKAYVAIEPGLFEDHDLMWWIVRGMRHLATLPPRLPSPKPAPARRSQAKKKKKKPAKPPKARAKRAKNVARKAAQKKVTRKAAPAPTRKAPKQRTVPRKKRPAPKKRGGQR
jgi:TfoX/Sxy family transcriptional regulator of competence genes